MSEPQYIVTQAIAKALGYKTGDGLHEGFIVQCAGIVGPNPRFVIDSAAGLNPPTETLNRHVIATLGAHAPGAERHSIGNAEFDDSLWTIEANQSAIDWSAPKCQLCGKEPAP